MWFKKKKLIEKKESATTSLIVMGMENFPVWTEEDYEKLSKEGYQKNIIAYRCIDDISKSAASVPWQLFRKTADGKEEIKEHEILTLIERPNPRQSWTSFIYKAMAFLQISGNTYFEGVTAGQTGTDNTKVPIRELWVTRPDRMKIIPSSKSLIAAYEYDVGGKKFLWRVDPKTGKANILHIPLFHPTDDYYGYSPIMAAAHNIDIHNESNAWNKKLLDNDAKPSGILISEKTLDVDQKRRMKSELRRKWSGSKNAGKPVLLAGAWKWIQTSMSPHDMDWLNSQNTSARDICHAFGYPPFLLGLPGNSTFNNMEMAKLWLWENTIFFYLNLLRDEFNVWLIPRFDESESIFLDYDLSSVPALAARRNVKWERAEKSKDFATINERREMVGLPPLEGGDTILVPISSIPIEAAGISSEEGEKSEFKNILISEGNSIEKANELTNVAFSNNFPPEAKLS